MTTLAQRKAFTCLHLFCGLGGGALGFKRAGFESVGAFDCDPDAIADHDYLTGDRGTVADLSTMTPDELRNACTGRPDVLFTSPPCKSFSGCLGNDKAETEHYRDLSDLALRGVWLALEAWKTPPQLIIMENVPRIMTRGRKWLDQLTGLLQAYGYAVRESTHDCGELGGLGQRRRRFLLVARHMGQVPEVLYEPVKRAHKSVGDVIGDLPVPTPGSDAGGPMHRLPRLSALNWTRLALIPAGGDWRDLPERVALATRKSRHNGGYGVEGWDGPAHSVLGNATVRDTRSSVADPRVNKVRREGSLGVQSPNGTSTSVIGALRVHNWPAGYADPRINCTPRAGVYGVQGADVTSPTVVGNARHDNGRWSYADVRLAHTPRRGTMGVGGWATPTHTVIGDSRSNKGQNVADPRPPIVVGETEIDLVSRKPCHLVIEAEDGTWHRPLTTLELAAIQGFPTKVNGEWLKLSGNSHKAWRQRIGNAVPPPAAEAVAREMLKTLNASANGELLMSSTSIWVAPVLEPRSAA